MPRVATWTGRDAARRRAAQVISYLWACWQIHYYLTLWQGEGGGGRASVCASAALFAWAGR